MLLGNVTHHYQYHLTSKYTRLGFEIEPKTPLLKTVHGSNRYKRQENARHLAYRAIQRCLSIGVDGVLVGGKTDVCIYAYLFATAQGLPCFTTHFRNDPDYDGRYYLADITPIVACVDTCQKIPRILPYLTQGEHIKLVNFLGATIHQDDIERLDDTEGGE